jgi:putative membrane protein insertion efficiency factor
MKRVMIALIRFYQKHISGLKRNPTCRFYPTCSAYALEAFEKRGFFAGLVLSVWRILRCSPLSPCGFDPVPKKGFKTMPARYSKYDKMKNDEELLEWLEEDESDSEKTDEEKDAHADAEASDGDDTQTEGCDKK